MFGISEERIDHVKEIFLRAWSAIKEQDELGLCMAELDEANEARAELEEELSIRDAELKSVSDKLKKEEASHRRTEKLLNSARESRDKIRRKKAAIDRAEERQKFSETMRLDHMLARMLGSILCGNSIPVQFTNEQIQALSRAGLDRVIEKEAGRKVW
jgi:predicted  nucleic acid-binding Zn-ribbon protein